ncbi:MAG: ribosomal-protein-alanine N-acetyltransferase [Gammaproteobacteria bacterium]|nr:MAG: ribosomal-protein-alanine N-acetyltransferase [Gammaproteobacteria bacterium]
MTAHDLPAVMEIEHRSYDFPWTEGIFHDCMRFGYSSWVTEIDRDIIGYAVMSLAVQECHILNLCIDPKLQGQGIGRRLLLELLDIARVREADTAFLEVRPSNVQALSLYFSEGFNEIGSRRDYYPAKFGREDAVILAKALTK